MEHLSKKPSLKKSCSVWPLKILAVSMLDCVQSPLLFFLNNGGGSRNGSSVPHSATCLECQDKVLPQFLASRPKTEMFQSEKASCFYALNGKFSLHSLQLKGDLPSFRIFRTNRYLFFVQRNECRDIMTETSSRKCFFFCPKAVSNQCALLFCALRIFRHTCVQRTLLWQSSKCYLGLK